MKKILLAVLLLSLLLALCACGAPNTEALEQKTRAFLDCFAAGDEEGAYALFYPDAVDRESFHASFDGLHSTFPMTGDYSLSLGGYNETRYVGTRNQTVETAQFQLENDGKQYRLTVVYQSDRDGEGFTNFEMVLLLNPAG